MAVFAVTVCSVFTIGLMFSNQEVKPMPVKEYREYMKECKREAKDYKQK